MRRKMDMLLVVMHAYDYVDYTCSGQQSCPSCLVTSVDLFFRFTRASQPVESRFIHLSKSTLLVAQLVCNDMQ